MKSGSKPFSTSIAARNPQASSRAKSLRASSGRCSAAAPRAVPARAVAPSRLASPGTATSANSETAFGERYRRPKNRAASLNGALTARDE